ncbi:O-acetyltransferase OatA [Ferrovum sp. JA12]|uniref:acyltransferase family protein n=1 Tax=Ferrovum sp. JA12 TaxID=1356299 RepID=UPI0007026F46|nr:acyltransferase family protein [Ferrovum sp. JA12]KRH79568.1 O-acetyltransferase OatA [Ferrovum sp. JA12]HQT81740.1 acyltransferase family protein [Ferrovaceae bacterium]HQU06850.1 acyltransferase family protein [Ferrovaceae bacterium]
MSSIQHKLKIDGLRGVAILFVLIFHFFPEKFPAGFIGVDIFFVISGFFMTKIIFTDLDQHDFQLVNFYHRRIKRLIPSILTVVTLTFLVGYFFLGSHAFTELSKESLGSLFFYSNILFLKEAGYFDQHSLYKPLLHFWSLGIEEQFYFIWPLLLIWIFKNKVNRLYFLIIIITFSFSLNLFYFLSGNYNIDFYLPFTRFWELGIGAVITLVNIKPLKISLSYFGTLLLILSLFIIKDSSQYPGYIALIPVFATSLIILADDYSIISTYLYSNRFLVWTGKISFNLYLVHWPIIVFFFLFNAEVIKHLRFPLLVLSYLLASLIHYFIENPLRYSTYKPLAPLLIFANIALGLLAGFSYMNHGQIFNKPVSLIEEKNIQQITWNDTSDDLCKKFTSLNTTFCKIYGNKNNITVAIIGDSTANHLGPGIAKYMDLNKEGLINLGDGTCPIILGLKENSGWGGPRSKEGKNCVQDTSLIINYLLSTLQIKTVILGFWLHEMDFWGVNKDEVGVARLSTLIINEANLFHRHNIKTVVTFGSPYTNADIIICMRPTMSETSFCKNKFYLIYEDNLFNSLQRKLENQVITFNQAQYLEKLNINYIYDSSDLLILRDDHHYSYHGSALIGEKLIQLIK